MTVRRDGSMMRSADQSIRGSRIVVAIFIGVFIGGVFAFYYPHGFFSTNDSALYEAQKISKSNSQTGSSECESAERINMIKSEIMEMSDNQRSSRLLCQFLHH